MPSSLNAQYQVVHNAETELGKNFDPMQHIKARWFHGNRVMVLHYVTETCLYKGGERFFFESCLTKAGEDKGWIMTDWKAMGFY